MTQPPGALIVLPCKDSPDLAADRRRELDLSRSRAEELGRAAVEAATLGYYLDQKGERVDWSPLVQDAIAKKVSLPPDAALPISGRAKHPTTRVQVCNETTLQAARRLVDAGSRPLALNFANGVHPGGGFLMGARAQEEVLCRSSALFSTLVDDPMYLHHRSRSLPDSTDWTIYSPDVPVFRTDDGSELDRPWLVSILTSAAPYAPRVGQPRSGDLLQKRIWRVLAVASAYEHEALVLGAWGCGAFSNDPNRTALDFRRALEGEFRGDFADVVFAISDWSPERRFLGPFRDAFAKEV